MVVVAAYRKGRRYSALEDFPPYQETDWHPSSHDHSFREPPFKTQQYQPYRYRPYRQDLTPHAEQLSFKDQLSLRDYALKLRDQPFYDNSSSFKNASDFHGQSLFFANETPFKYQEDKDRTVYRNERPFQYQPLNDRYSSYRQTYRDDFRFADVYDKPIEFHKEQSRQQQVDSFGRDSEYLKHGKHPN